MTAKAKGRKQTPDDDNNINALVEAFVFDVRQTLLPNEYQGTALYKFLFQMAAAYHLPTQDVDAILNEGVKRGIEYIQRKKTPINYPSAWLRGTCLRIMKSRVEQNIKYEAKSQKASEMASPPKSLLAESELLEQLEYLEKAVAKLPEMDQQLLRMKFWENKTYKQIRHHYKLMSISGSVPSIAAFRKRESRALERLRKSFFKLYEESEKSQN